MSWAQSCIFSKKKINLGMRIYHNDFQNLLWIQNPSFVFLNGLNIGPHFHIEVLSRVTRIKLLLFLLSISHICLGYSGPMRTQALRVPKQDSLAQGEPSQIWEILKRKSSHLNLVTFDNTLKFQLEFLQMLEISF